MSDITTGEMLMAFEEASRAASREILRANEKHGAAQTPMNPEMGVLEGYVILAEEVGEVARALTYDGDEGAEHLYEEYVQVAAMALANAAAVRLRDSLRVPDRLSSPVANPRRTISSSLSEDHIPLRMPFQPISSKE